MNRNMLIEGYIISVVIQAILAPAIASSEGTSSAADAVYEWNRVEYEVLADPGILADTDRVRSLRSSLELHFLTDLILNAKCLD